MNKVLHIGSGKIDFDPTITTPDFHVHLDRSYSAGISHNIEYIEKAYVKGNSGHYFASYDIFDFMDHFKFKFNHIEAFRIFEHMEFVSGEIGRLLESCNKLTTSQGTLDIIVPNAELIAKLLKDFRENKQFRVKMENIKLIINSETNNCRCDPHLSCWTPSLAEDYIESEGTWEITDLEPKINFAGRDIYMRILCRKTY